MREAAGTHGASPRRRRPRASSTIPHPDAHPADGLPPHVQSGLHERELHAGLPPLDGRSPTASHGRFTR